MDITFPPYLENILKGYLKQTFYADSKRAVFSAREFGPQDLKYFSEGAKTLSDLFTSERSTLAANYLNDKKLRAGYLLYFLPLNFCKVQSVLKKLPLAFFHQSKIRILDMGCGPGTFTLALMDAVFSLHAKDPKACHHIEILSLDQNYHALKDAQALHEEMLKHYRKKNPNVKMTFISRTFDLRRGKPDTLLKNDQYDLIVAANFFNEWVSAKAEEKGKFLEKIYDRHLSKEGYLILMEPALQRSTRELMLLRDQIISKKSLKVFAPCLHQNSCPMLQASGRDWCHFYISWKEPDFMLKLDKLTKNKNDFLKCSYMIFTSKDRSELTQIPTKHDPHRIYRAISNLMKTRGKAELVICGPAGRWHLTRLDKEKSESNRALDQIQRGDFLWVEKLGARSFQAEGELRIEKADAIGVVRT